MKILVTGSAGHLGEALMRILPLRGHTPIGVDIQPSDYTDYVGTLVDKKFVSKCVEGAEAIIHTATLHKPHVATHSKQDFVDTNITGTLNLLEAAQIHGIDRFIFTSTTSAFGDALTPKIDEPAAWIDETVIGLPKNIYGATKTAAEDLCALFAKKHQQNCVILRTSRFFPEDDDNKATREMFSDRNAKANEFLFRRVDIEDAAIAHINAVDCARDIKFGKYIVSAPSPFSQNDLVGLRTRPSKIIAHTYPDFPEIYKKSGFKMLADISRVYASQKAQNELGWQPTYDFGKILMQIAAGEPIGSSLSREIGKKGYHSEIFADGPYPVDA